jgi:hypothetical protein
MHRAEVPCRKYLVFVEEREDLERMIKDVPKETLIEILGLGDDTKRTAHSALCEHFLRNRKQVLTSTDSARNCGLAPGIYPVAARVAGSIRRVN